MNKADTVTAHLIRDWIQSEIKAVISYARGEVKSYEMHSKLADKGFAQVLDSIPEEK